MADVSGFLSDPDEEVVFGDHSLAIDKKLTEADLPESWPKEVRSAFWRSCNAPTYSETQKETLRFAMLLACHIKESATP